MKVLLIAEAANPEWTSVPLVGWSHCRAIARLMPSHLVTQIRNRDAIVRAGLGSEEFTAIDSEAVAKVVWRASNLLRGGAGKGWTTGVALQALVYPYFERLVWRAFGARIRAREFDVVHRVTPLSPTLPSLLARRCARAGVPFVLGPLNGGVAWPAGFDSERRREREWLSYVRSAYRFLPGFRSTRRHSAAILVASRDTLGQMPVQFRDKCVYIPENGVDPELFPAVRDRPPAPPLRVAFVGRLVPYKGADMLLEASAGLVRDGRVTIDIIGDGPEMPRLREIAERERLGDGVAFPGWVEHRSLRDRLAAAHVLGFPSVREFGGGVVLEAMALGVAPVVLDYGGPGELVTARTGVALPMGRREQIVAQFRQTLERLAREPESVAAMGARARQRVLRHFTWDAKARQVAEVYEWVLGRRSSKPDFGVPIPDEDSEPVGRATTTNLIAGAAGGQP